MDEIKSWTCPVCGAASSSFETYWAHESDADIQGFVGHDKSRQQIVVAFRGSKTLANWIANLKFARVDSPFKECHNCMVHKGFLDDYNSIAVELFRVINDIRAKTGIKRVLVTGHSLGAVLALLTAVDLVIHDGFAEPVLYAFGLPRVGNEEFEKFANSKAAGFRVVHQNDIVPQLPPQGDVGKLFDFHHPPTEVWYRSGEPYKVCDKEGEDPSCQDSVPFLHLSAADHTWYLNMSTGCSSKEVPFDDASALAFDEDVWRAVRSNNDLKSYVRLL